MLSGGTMAAQDVPPYLIAQGDRAQLRGLNRVGLRRLDVSSTTITELQRAYRTIFLSQTPFSKRRKTGQGSGLRRSHIESIFRLHRHLDARLLPSLKDEHTLWLGRGRGSHGQPSSENSFVNALMSKQKSLIHQRA